VLQCLGISRVFGHAYLPVRFEATVVVDQVADVMPQFEGVRASGISASWRDSVRTPPALTPEAWRQHSFFDNDRPDLRESPDAKRPSNHAAATDDYDIGRPGIHRADSHDGIDRRFGLGSAASSPSVMGLIGKRSR
jgi:hypothetical protein